MRSTGVQGCSDAVRGPSRAVQRGGSGAPGSTDEGCPSRAVQRGVRSTGVHGTDEDIQGCSAGGLGVRSTGVHRRGLMRSGVQGCSAGGQEHRGPRTRADAVRGPSRAVQRGGQEHRGPRTRADAVRGPGCSAGGQEHRGPRTRAEMRMRSRAIQWGGGGGGHTGGGGSRDEGKQGQGGPLSEGAPVPDEGGAGVVSGGPNKGGGPVSVGGGGGSVPELRNRQSLWNVAYMGARGLRVGGGMGLG